MRQLLSAGHEVELLARKDEALARAAKKEGMTVHEVPTAMGLATFLLKHARRFDVLHAQTAGALTWLALLKFWLGRPIVFTRRTAFQTPGHRLQRTLWKWRKVDRFVAISQASASQPRQMGLEVDVIPSAVEARSLDLRHGRDFVARFNPRRKRMLATAAALTREKDPCTLIRAVHSLRQWRDDFVFVHMGGEGELQEQAHKLVQELGLEQVYLFAGFEPNPEDVYRFMDAFVCSSREEALGSSVLDAMLYAVPVVSTDAGGLAETLAEGRGLLCPVGDHEALARAMDRVLSDGPLRGEMVEKAQAYVLEEHDLVRMGERYVKVYASLLKDWR